VTAHNKRARIHIWQKVWKKHFRTKLCEFYRRWLTRKGFFAPHYSGKGFSLMAIIERAIKKIYIVYFLEFILKMIFIIIFVFFALLL